MNLTFGSPLALPAAYPLGTELLPPRRRSTFGWSYEILLGIGFTLTTIIGYVISHAHVVDGWRLLPLPGGIFLFIAPVLILLWVPESPSESVTSRHRREASSGGNGISVETDPRVAEHPRPRGRRPRDPVTTKADLLAATRKLLERDGVLAGLNLQEVAVEAGVNRGQIYQYFGSRRALLRAALGDMTRRWHEARVFHEDRSLPFAQRRLKVFEEALENRAFIQLEALLALDDTAELDGDEQFRLFPWLEQSRQDLARDKVAGDLAPEVDALVAHAATATVYLGYGVFRQVLARDLGIAADELDRRMIPVVAAMIEGATRAVSDQADRLPPSGRGFS